MTDHPQQQPQLSGDDYQRRVTVIAHIRCAPCRGRTLIAVVYSDESRRWLVMNPPGEEHRGTLNYMVRGNSDWPGLSLAGQLDELRREFPWVVMELEPLDEITEPYPWVSVSCPRCSPSGLNSSWLLDYRKIAGEVEEGRVTQLSAADVSADGTGRQILDRDLGYRPHNDFSQIEEWIALLESRRVESSEQT